MGAHVIEPATAMASRWRRRPVCTLTAERTAPAALIEVSGRGALVMTSIRPAPGAWVTLWHPEAGAIDGAVLGGDPAGLRLRFDGGALAVAFALAATAADMSRG